MPEVMSLQQVNRQQLQGHQVQHNDSQHLLIIDGAVVPCTPAEYDVLCPCYNMLENRCHFLTCLVRKDGNNLLAA